MSTQTPRKFSEKIAMMMRKQNEDQESFATVMNDVRNITKKPSNSPGSSDGSPVGPSPDMYNMQMPSSYLPGQPIPPNLLCAGPPHPMWGGRPGGSISMPNVHQMAQSAPDMFYNWGQWPGGQPMQNSHPQPNQSYAQTHRTRSPGAQHYHPYRKSNEKLPQHDPALPPTVHLQPPDPSWSNRARSDPTIHMNTVNPNYYYNGQQWSPDMLTNGQHPVHQPPPPQQQQQQQQQPNMYQSPPQATQPAMAPPAHLGYPPAQYQQSMGNYQNNIQQIHQPMNDIPIGSLPSNPSYMMQHTPPSSSSASPAAGPMSAGPFTNHQQLSTPAVVSESQSAPTSPAQSYELPRRQQWPPTRHYSASPDTIDIPNIVLTGADGTSNIETLECFAGLQLDSEDMRQLMSDSTPLDPSCETQLLN